MIQASGRPILLLLVDDHAVVRERTSSAGPPRLLTLCTRWAPTGRRRQSFDIRVLARERALQPSVEPAVAAYDASAALPTAVVRANRGLGPYWSCPALSSGEPCTRYPLGTDCFEPQVPALPSGMSLRDRRPRRAQRPRATLRRGS